MMSQYLDETVQLKLINISSFPKYVIWFLPAVFLLVACGGGKSASSIPNKIAEYSYQAPVSSDDGWIPAHLNEVGVKVNTIEKMINDQQLEKIKFHSLLIVRNNRLVLEQYWSGKTSKGEYVNFDKDTLHELQSVSKSVTSLLVGLGISQGFITSIDDAIENYLPEYGAAFSTIEKSNISVRNILMMQSGIEWDEWTLPYSDDRNSHVAMNLSDDPIDYVLSQPMAMQPGTSFVYNSGLTIAAGKILENSTQQNLAQYARDNLFTPLDIRDVDWYRYSNGIYQTGGGISMRPRDMAKLGQLILNNGWWNGESIIPEQWIKDSVSAKIKFPDNFYDDYYGYFWWRQEFTVNDQTINSIHAAGYGGQHIYIIPEFNLVLIFTAGNYDSVQLSNKPEQLIREYILPALNQ